jgi:hypothetical protein
MAYRMLVMVLGIEPHQTRWQVMFFTCQRTFIPILVMWSIRLLLLETRMWRAPLIGMDGGDGTSDAGDAAGDRTTSNEMARDLLYMPKNFHSNPGDVEYSPSVVRDRYLAAPFLGVEGGDGSSDVSDGAGDRTTSNDVSRDVPCMP